jgi:hypothetical protein
VHASRPCASRSYPDAACGKRRIVQNGFDRNLRRLNLADEHMVLVLNVYLRMPAVEFLRTHDAADHPRRLAVRATLNDGVQPI